MISLSALHMISPWRWLNLIFPSGLWLLSRKMGCKFSFTPHHPVISSLRCKRFKMALLGLWLKNTKPLKKTIWRVIDGVVFTFCAKKPRHLIHELLVMKLFMTGAKAAPLTQDKMKYHWNLKISIWPWEQEMFLNVLFFSDIVNADWTPLSPTDWRVLLSCSVAFLTNLSRRLPAGYT